jgi:2-polyprenyl-3-methyl-5-hydroxy-6-metoxy-1,4-benzoquinol methylase
MSDWREGVTKDPDHGYTRLDPIPEQGELSRFYQSAYYDLVRKGNRFPEMTTLLAGGAEAEAERSWQNKTLFADVAHLLATYAPSRRVLDVGAGFGNLMSQLKTHGFETVGIEPSESGTKDARGQGLAVHCGELKDFTGAGAATLGAPFGAVTMMNVLEHVPDPFELIRQASSLLIERGVLCIRVPNDFSPLQKAANPLAERQRWWIAVPDHINYFDFGSLSELLAAAGFDTLYAQGDFPMELFILMGDDYSASSEVGRSNHRKRRSFELAVPDELRRDIYRALATVGVGRNALVVARKRG